MSAYREGRETIRRKPFMILCTKCGKRRVVREAVADAFTCEGCDLEQPVFAVERATSVSPVAKSYEGLPAGVARSTAEDLDAFAREMGIRPPVTLITVACEGVELVVELATSSGTPVGVDLRAKTQGFYAMTLTRETELHGEAKRTGLTVEVQTGDAEFDAKVFIESRASQEDIALTFASRAVREAAVAVLEHTETLEFSADAISVTLRGNDAYQPEKLRALLAALRTLAGAPRSLTAVTEATPGRVVAARIFFGLAFPSSVGLFGYAVAHYAPFGPMIGLLGGCLAFLVWIVLQPPLRRIVAGRSSSHTEFAVMRLMLLVDLVLFGIGALVIYNAVFDAAPPRNLELSAFEVGYDGENHQALVYAMDGPEKHTFRFEDPKKEIRLPATVTVKFRRGRLGFPWQEGPATVHFATQHKSSD